MRRKKSFAEHTDSLRHATRSLAEFDPAQFSAHLAKLQAALSSASPDRGWHCLPRKNPHLLRSLAMPDAPAPSSPYTRQNPFPGKLVVNRRLNPGSQKDTRHLEVDLTGWGLSFEVGDSMAVYASNDPELVEEILHALGAKGDEMVPRPKGDPRAVARGALEGLSHHATDPEASESHRRARLERAVAHGIARIPSGNRISTPTSTAWR